MMMQTLLQQLLPLFSSFVAAAVVAVVAAVLIVKEWRSFLVSVELFFEPDYAPRKKNCVCLRLHN